MTNRVLEMLRWGEDKTASNAKHEWLEEPLSGGPLVRRSNLMQTFGFPHPTDRDRGVARAAIAGRPGPSGSERRMSGLVHLIREGADPVILDCMGAPLSLESVRMVQEESWERGGMPSVLLVGPRANGTIQPPEEKRRPPMRPYCDYSLITDFGILDVLISIVVPEDMALLIDHLRACLVSTDSGLCQATLEARNAGDGGHALIQNIGAAA